MTASTDEDAVSSREHDERLDFEHSVAALDVMFVLEQRSSDPVPVAGKVGVVTQGALALPEHNFQQVMVGSGCVRAMIVKLGPLLGHLFRIGDEVAIWDDAANVVVTLVPMGGPG